MTAPLTLRQAASALVKAMERYRFALEDETWEHLLRLRNALAKKAAKAARLAASPIVTQWRSPADAGPDTERSDKP